MFFFREKPYSGKYFSRTIVIMEEKHNFSLWNKTASILATKKKIHEPNQESPQHNGNHKYFFLSLSKGKKEQEGERERERAEAKNKRPGLPSSSVSVHFTFSLWVSSLFTQRVFGASPIHQHAIYRFFKTSKNTTAKRRQVGSRYTDIGYSTVKEKIYFLESKRRKNGSSMKNGVE